MEITARSIPWLWSLTADALNALFSPYGELTDFFVAHRSNKPRGFGFVTFKEPACAKKACTEINGRVVEGSREVNGAKEKREVRVTFARERPEGERYERKNAAKGGNSTAKSKKQEKSARKRKTEKGDEKKESVNVDNAKKRTTNASVAVPPPTVTTSSKTTAPKWGDIVKGKTKVKQSSTTTSESKKQSSPTKKKQQQQQQQVSKEFAKLEANTDFNFS